MHVTNLNNDILMEWANGYSCKWKQSLHIILILLHSGNAQNGYLLYKRVYIYFNVLLFLIRPFIFWPWYFAPIEIQIVSCLTNFLISDFATDRLEQVVIMSGAIFQMRMASLTQVFWTTGVFPISTGFFTESALVLTLESSLDCLWTFRG